MVLVPGLMIGCLLSLVHGSDVCHEVEHHRNLKLLPQGEDCEAPRIFTKKIIGGEDALLREFPWIVSIRCYRRFWCGGSVINEKYVLTAAHCLTEPQHHYTVLVGVDNIDSYEDCGTCNGRASAVQNFRINKIILHENHGQEEDEDIALARVIGKIAFNDVVKPICLPTLSGLIKQDFQGRKVTVAGWGNLRDFPSSVKPAVLQKIELPVTSIKQCIQIWSKAEPYPEKVNENMHICTGGGPEYQGKDACRGDSGGPMMYETEAHGSSYEIYLVGVVSKGDLCQAENPMKPGIFMNVAHYMPWLLNNIEE